MGERKRQGLELTKGSVAHKKHRLNEQYDGTEASLREQIVLVNSYNLFFRHQPSKPWYRSYSNEYMKGNGQGLCGKCKSYFFFFSFDFLLITSTGLDSFLESDLLMATFYLQRIPGSISTAADVDRMGLHFDVHVSHASCITAPAWIRFITPSSTFHDSVYFHPNVDTDGWETLKGFHEVARVQFEKNGLGLAKGKGKGKGKKGKGKETPNIKFPPFPLQPHFWLHAESGSTIGLWPPKLFHPWVVLAQQGGTLTLDPPQLNVPGPSNPQPPQPPQSPSSQHSPSFNPSINPSQNPTQVLKTPPPMDGDLDEIGSDDGGT